MCCCSLQLQAAFVCMLKRASSSSSSCYFYIGTISVEKIDDIIHTNSSKQRRTLNILNACVQYVRAQASIEIFCC